MKWALPFIGIILFYNVVFAYETQTHDELSEPIVLNSVLELEPDFLISLGLEFDSGIREEALPSYVPRDANNPTPDDPRFEPNATILEIIRGGSVLEDHGNQPINHFFDVQNGGRPSNIFGIPIPGARPSPEWVLEIDSNGNRLDIEGQEHSYSDALDYFYDPLRGIA